MLNKKIINEPKILIFDIETAPNLGYIWAKYQQDVISYKSEWYILSFCAKWEGSKKMYKYKLNDFNLFKKDKENDYEVVKKLWGLLNEADIVITHNGDSFDIRKANARFIFHGLNPPEPFKSIDTKKIAKRYFNFNSNSLNDLGKYLKIGNKIQHSGFSLWKGCMAGDRKSFNQMIKYNEMDVILTEKLYNKLRPWITNHPNYGIYRNQNYICPNCGGKHLQCRGFAYTKTCKYQRTQCQSCFAWSQHVKSEKINKPMLKN